MGVSVNEIKSDSKIATANVMANSLNKRPITSLIKSKGKSTATSDNVSEINVNVISWAPFSEACRTDKPCSIWRAMFSIMTMASSTTNPVAIVKAINVKLLMLKPASNMMPKVPTSDNGTTMPGIRVAVQVRKNTNVTKTTKPTASNNSFCTLDTASRMV